jgi:predicted nucleic acid-binding protein
MLLYVDLNCFNRPFDDQSQARIARETEAVLSILQRIVDGVDQLAWSAVLRFENSRHPLLDRRNEIARWRGLAAVNVSISRELASRAEELVDTGVAPLDATHLASAEAAACDCFLTCDDRLMRKGRNLHLSFKLLNPVEYWEECTHA